MLDNEERSAPRLEPGTTLSDRYELVRRIAIGGMGEVWQATDQVLGRTVAVKVMRAELADSHEFIERFRAEARHTAGLSHPGIASVYDYGEDGPFAFLVMELVDGEPLSHRLHRQPVVPLAEALSILAQTGDALQAAHDAGVVHRDVKPGNLMLRADGVVKVTDFGIARAVDSVPVTAVGQVVGTAQYMSPEQAAGHGTSPASDVYSLGVVGYEMLAGHRPFRADSPIGLAMAHLHEVPAPLPDDLPTGIRRLIEQSLGKTPDVRPESAQAFATEARRGLLAILPPPGEAQPAGPTAGGRNAAATMVGVLGATEIAPARAPRILIDQREIRPRRARALAGAALFVLIAIIAIVLASRDDSPQQLVDAAMATAPLSEGATTTVAPVLAPVEPVVAVTNPATVVVDPNVLVGYGAEQAELVLRQLGFQVSTETEKSRAARGVVVRVEPNGDVPYGATVTLFVSEGKGKKDDGNDD